MKQPNKQQIVGLLKNIPSYRDWLWEVFKKPLEHQRPSWDLTTVYYAVEGLRDFLCSAGNGVLEFDVEKGCRWNQLQNQTSQVYLYQKVGTNESFADYLNEMISTKPLHAGK